MTPNENEPATLTTAANEFEAAVVAAALRSHGIEARVVSIVGTALSPFASALNDPIRVLVRRRDLEAAKEALSGLRADSVDIDWSELDVGQAEDPLAARRPLGVRRWMGVSAVAALLFVVASLSVVVASVRALPVFLGAAVALLIAAGAIGALRAKSKSKRPGNRWG